jgi:hypothetical protein
LELLTVGTGQAPHLSLRAGQYHQLPGVWVMTNEVTNTTQKHEYLTSGELHYTE